MEQVRSFIAIELPDEVKSALKRLVAQLKSNQQRGIKWVDPDSIHLTLKFLGSVNADRIKDIVAAMEKAAKGIPPFRLEVNGLGVFPNPRRVRVAWVGVDGEVERLMQLQQQLEANVAPLGFPTEARPFTAHLTLARVREGISWEEQQRFGELITKTKFEESHSFNVDSVNLMKSQLTREGAIYSRISSVKLEG